jgi:hypothetical protein
MLDFDEPLHRRNRRRRKIVCTLNLHTARIGHVYLRVKVHVATRT